MTERYANQQAPTFIVGTLAFDADTGVVFAQDGLPSAGNFRIIVGQGTSAEIVVVGGRTGTTLTGLQRGQEGTTAQTWPEGTPVSHVLTAASYGAGIDDKISDHAVEDDPHPGYATDVDLAGHETDPSAHPGLAAGGDVTGAITAHEAGADPHPVYLTSAEGDAKVTAHTAAGDPHSQYATDTDLTTHHDSTNPHPNVDGGVAVAGHVAGVDPHTQYQKESERGVANGYAGLDASGTVPDAQIPSAIARDTEVTSAVNTHSAASDPHPGYATDNDLANHAAASDPHPTYATDSDLSTHVAASDPHAGYQKESEKGNALGYASLDSGGTVPDGQIPSAITRDSELAAHEADTTAIHGITDTSVLETVTGSQAKVNTHAAAADPHPVYQTSAESQAQVDTHVAAADPHPQYDTSAEAQAKVDTHAAANPAHPANKVSFTPYNTLASTNVQAAIQEMLDETAAHPNLAAHDALGLATDAELATHAAAANPHTVYQLSSAKGTANGYASLDAGGTVPDAQIPAAIARDAEVTSAVATHAAAGDPHPAYATDTDLTNHAAAADPHTGYVQESVGTTAGDLLYFSGASTPARLGTNSTATKKYLQTVSSGNPSYAQVDFADLSGSIVIGAIPDDLLTFAKLPNVPTDSLVGRDTAGTGDAENILLNATLSMDGSGNLQRAALTGDVTAPAGSNVTTLASGSASVLNSGTLAAGRMPAHTGDVTSSAGSVALTLAAGSASVLNSGTLLAARMPALTGDVTTTVGTVATTIANDAVSYAKMQNVTATSRFLGRKTAGAGDPEELTAADAKTILAIDLSTSDVTGVLAAARHPALTGDVTTASGSVATTISNDAVTYAKLQNVSANNRILGRISGANGDPEELTAANVKTILALSTADIAGYTTLATDLLWSSAGDLVYGTGAHAAAVLPANATATNKYLRSVSSGAPTWQQIAYADISGTPSSLPPSSHGASVHDDITRSFWIDIPLLASNMNSPNNASFSTSNTGTDSYQKARLADGLTQGFFFKVPVPTDWASGAVTYKIHWIPSATSTGAVRWSISALDVAPGGTIATAVTPLAYTGDNAARTANLLAVESAQTLVTPSAAGNVIRCSLQRIGTDGADTYVGNVDVIGIQVLWTATQ